MRIGGGVAVHGDLPLKQQIPYPDTRTRGIRVLAPFSFKQASSGCASLRGFAHRRQLDTSKVCRAVVCCSSPPLVTRNPNAHAASLFHRAKCYFRRALSPAPGAAVAMARARVRAIAR